MVERRPTLGILAHLVLLLGVPSVLSLVYSVSAADIIGQVQ